MKITIVATGDELVKGLVHDTNSPALARKFREKGFEVVAHMVVRDSKEELASALSWALERSDAVLVTGGLGPTQDDINREVVAEFVGRPLERDPDVLRRLEGFFLSRGLPLTHNNEKQADFPRGATVFPNPRGTAPGFAVEKDGTQIICAPGVPRELLPMIDEGILPFLEGRCARDEYVCSATLKTFGLTESRIDELLANAFQGVDTRGLTLGLIASFPEVHIVLTLSGEDHSRTTRRLHLFRERLEGVLGDIVVSSDGSTMEEVVGHGLRERGLGLVVAESCTGGLIGDRITRVSGSSAYFLGGVIAYNEALKVSLVGVRASTIERTGVVSIETAFEMARGALNLRGTGGTGRVGVAVTGWMEDPPAQSGRGSGSARTNFCCALVAPDGGWAKGFSLFGDRLQRKLLSSEIALEMLRRYLKGLELDRWAYPLVTEERTERW